MGVVHSTHHVIALESTDVQKLVEHLNDKTNALYEDAYDIARGVPITDEVYHGVKLRCYGSPKSMNEPTSEYYHHSEVTIDTSLLNGWHIYYLDSNGYIMVIIQLT